MNASWDWIWRDLEKTSISSGTANWFFCHCYLCFILFCFCVFTLLDSKPFPDLYVRGMGWGAFFYTSMIFHPTAMVSGHKEQSWVGRASLVTEAGLLPEYRLSDVGFLIPLSFKTRFRLKSISKYKKQMYKGCNLNRSQRQASKFYQEQVFTF